MCEKRQGSSACRSVIVPVCLVWSLAGRGNYRQARFLAEAEPLLRSVIIRAERPAAGDLAAGPAQPCVRRGADRRRQEQLARRDGGERCGSGLWPGLIDLKGDLVETVLERLPVGVVERVIVLDPSLTDRPVGFNPLAVPGSDEHARELAADRVLHIFKDLYRANWGPRSDDLLRAALQTLVSVAAPNGQAFTICEVPELLAPSVAAVRRAAAGTARCAAGVLGGV